MKNLIKIATALILLVHTIGYSQEERTSTITKKQDAKTSIDTEKFKSFVGIYLLEEADFELEIVQEDTAMYIVSPFSKDLLVQKNETTLREPTRGVDLERIEADETGLKFTQNGYETVIKRVKPKSGD
jgi:hypothetical protein